MNLGERVSTTALARWAGVGLVLAVGAIHVLEGPENFEEAVGIGLLFFLSGVGALAAAVGIIDDRRWGWSLGAVVSAACLLGYLLSRTVGIPGKHEPSWEAVLEPMGVASLVAEAAFLVLAARVIRVPSGQPVAPGRA